MDTPSTVTGSCECGGVRFALAAPLRPVTSCHCNQCRKMSGHFWAATSVPDAQFTMLADSSLRWFRSSPTVERGFCGTCGSSLFYRPVGQGRMAIGAGTLDAPTGLGTAKQIFLADKGDYYTPSADGTHHQDWGMT